MATAGGLKEFAQTLARLPQMIVLDIGQWWTSSVSVTPHA